MVLLPEGCICPGLTFMSSIQQEFFELAMAPVDAMSHFAESDAESRGAIPTREKGILWFRRPGGRSPVCLNHYPEFRDDNHRLHGKHRY
jgi:hypothetical protein